MENGIASLPAYRMQEYLLVLSPHDELIHKILKVKREFAEKYRTVPARHSKPHLALAKFTNWQMMEEKLLQRLQLIAMGVAPFKIELKDFGSVPSHAIHINVATRLPVEALLKQLKAAQHLMRINGENKAHFIETAQLAIARKLKPWQYEQGWLEYAHRHFTGRFVADGMLLLKRAVGDKGAYQIEKRFAFQNLPVATKQGELFG